MLTIKTFVRSVMPLKLLGFGLLILISSASAARSQTAEAFDDSASQTSTGIGQDSPGQDDTTTDNLGPPAGDTGETPAAVSNPLRAGFYWTVKNGVLATFSPDGNFLQPGTDWQLSFILLPQGNFGFGLTGGIAVWSASAWAGGIRKPGFQAGELGLAFQYQPGSVGLRLSGLAAFGNISGTQLSFFYPAVLLDVYYSFRAPFEIVAIGLSTELELRKDPVPTLSTAFSLRIGGVPE